MCCFEYAFAHLFQGEKAKLKLVVAQLINIDVQNK